jgi:hypothetical protein
LLGFRDFSDGKQERFVGNMNEGEEGGESVRSDNLSFGRMSLEDLEIVLEWATEEGWNIGLDDAAAFFRAGGDGEGFYVAKKEDRRQWCASSPGVDVVAAISIVRHDANMAFLGLYICRKDCRGRGFGWAVWQYALSRFLSSSKHQHEHPHDGIICIGLDGVPAQVANYEKSGFISTGSTLRYQGRYDDAAATALAPDPSAATAVSTTAAATATSTSFSFNNNDTSTTIATESRRLVVRKMIADDLPTLHQLDTAAQGYARPQFLTAWLEGNGVLRDTVVLVDDETTANVDDDGRGSVVRGFATWRKCRNDGTTKIGPIIAPSTDGALQLLAAIAAVRPRRELLVVDVPESNVALRTVLAKTLGFNVSFATARMYRGTPPVPTDATLLQAIGTMELG